MSMSVNTANSSARILRLSLKGGISMPATRLESKARNKKKIIDAVVPRYRFGDSRYTTPILFILRLFYGAAPFDSFDLSGAHQPIYRASAPINICPQIWSKKTVNQGPEHHASSGRHTFKIAGKIPVKDWCDSLKVDASLASYRLISLTWVKALAANLTHEYIQFVISNPDTGARYRLLVDRNEDGDHVFAGHDWTSLTEPSPSHDLPLPLLSVSFDHLGAVDQPSLAEFAMIMANVTESQPEYNALRHMCWWYAEAILGVTLATFGGQLTEWTFAKLRYSLVVRTNVIKRKRLTKHAEDFRAMNASCMMY